MISLGYQILGVYLKCKFSCKKIKSLMMNLAYEFFLTVQLRSLFVLLGGWGKMASPEGFAKYLRNRLTNLYETV